MFEIALRKISCIKDTDGLGDDEPYVLVFAADISKDGESPVIGAASTLYGPFEGDDSMAEGDVKVLSNPKLCWGFDGKARAIDDPQDAIIMVALMESDTHKEFANDIRTIMHSTTFQALIGYVGADLDHAAIVQRLRTDMEGAIEFANFEGIPTAISDERQGRVKELKLTQEDLDNAQDDTIEKKLKFISTEEDSEYDLTFRIRVGVGTTSSGIEEGEPLDPNLDRWRCAATMDAGGNNLDVVSLPKGMRSIVRSFSPNGGSQWLSDWKSYQIGQGEFISGPAAAVSADGKKLHVFGLGMDNRIWRAFSSNGGASWDLAWAPIGQGIFKSGPATAVSADGKKLHVFGLGMDNRVWRAFSSNGGASWDIAWVPVGLGVFTSGPAAVISADGKQLHVFGRGNDKRIWRAFSSSGGTVWNLAWAPIGEGVFTSGPAAAVSADGKQLHVFGRGNDKRIWRAFSPDAGSRWPLAWAPIGEGVFSSGPAAVISADGKKLHVFGRGKHPPTPPPGTFGDPEAPRVWRAFSADGGKTWNVAWRSIKPAWVNAPVPA